jgi:Ca2+-binding EF-hand superfamily protein
MTSELLSHKLTHLFNLLDTTGDGSLDLRDFDLIVDNHAREIGADPGSEQVARYRAFVMNFWDSLVAFADTDADGSVSPAEFSAMFLLMAEDTDRVVRASRMVFDLFDTNGDGAIGLDEYLQYLRSYRVDDSGAAELFDTFDTNGDGSLSRDEFAALYVEFFTGDDPKALGNRLFGPI